MKPTLAAAILISFCFCIACGVKGRPLPPQTPREIGIGKPVYKGVDEELKKTEKKTKVEK